MRFLTSFNNTNRGTDRISGGSIYSTTLGQLKKIHFYCLCYLITPLNRLLQRIIINFMFVIYTFNLKSQKMCLRAPCSLIILSPGGARQPLSRLIFVTSFQRALEAHFSRDFIRHFLFAFSAVMVGVHAEFSAYRYNINPVQSTNPQHHNHFITPSFNTRSASVRLLMCIVQVLSDCKICLMES